MQIALETKPKKKYMEQRLNKTLQKLSKDKLYSLQVF
jgi:hypothetical protein